MADADDRPLPRPPVPPAPGQPLPRLWKIEPEPEPDAKPERKSRKERLAEEKEAEARAQAKAKGKSGASKTSKTSKDAKPKGALVEATPELDTYDSRRRVRFLIGGTAAAVGVIGIIVLFRTLFGGPAVDNEPLPDEGAIAVGSPDTPKVDRSDVEARNLLETARQLAKNGKTKEAIDVLSKVTKSYPKTATAAVARDALARPAKNLPLFLPDDSIVASPGSKPAAKSGAEPVVTVDASDNPRGKSGGSAEAQLNLPAVPAEAARGGNPPATPAGGTAAKSVPAGFRPVSDAGVHPSGWPNQISSDRDGAIMVLIPAGAFLQGREDGEPAEKPEHKVVLGAYYVDQHEVTVRQFNLHVKETGKKPVKPRTAKGEVEPISPGDDLPATNITWSEAKAYCEWAGKDLPTEAQWEAAARTTDGRLYPWGSSSPTWSRPRVPRQVDPVMSFPLDQSPYGVYDLAGNVWEYTRDWFDSKYYQTLKGQTADNPPGPTASRSRPPQVVVKGGSKEWFAPWRDGIKLDTRSPYIGFRGILAVDAQAAAGPPQRPVGAPGASPPPNKNGIVPL
jgi:formylglycine-generating enzyme